VIGLQWGDEAKGKIVDLLTERHDIVVRYQGGANAGHTVVAKGETYKLSLIPSGIFHPGVQCVIAGGVVLNPAGILEEIDHLTARGIKIGKNLTVSDRVHLILPWHFEEDRLIDEKCTSGEAIGTTMRGIGPCYCDKVGRSFAIRLGDMYRDNFRERIGQITETKKQILAGLGGSEEDVKLDAEEIFETYSGYAERLKPHVADTTAYLLNALEAGKRVLFEGAQGALLDIDHGTFPFVTSSNSSGVGVSPGSGVPGRYIERVIGILKAYTTRVGGGPFPTEQDNDTGQHIRDRQRIRHGHPATAALRLVRRGCRQIHGTAQWRGRPGGHAPRRSRPVAGTEDLYGLRDRRPANDRFPRPRGRFAQGGPRLRDFAGLAAGDQRGSPHGRSAGERSGISRPHQRAGRPPGGNRLGGARSGTNDFCGIIPQR